MIRFQMLKALLAMFMIGSTSAHAGSVRVIDGDGFMLDGREVRLWGIDAPELTQECLDRAGEVLPCGQIAKRTLERILSQNAPVCETVTMDRYGRHVSRCTVGAHDLGRVMVLSGWAVDFGRYSGGEYADAESIAERQNRGLWDTVFVRPDEWRKLRN